MGAKRMRFAAADKEAEPLAAAPRLLSTRRSKQGAAERKASTRAEQLQEDAGLSRSSSLTVFAPQTPDQEASGPCAPCQSPEPQVFDEALELGLVATMQAWRTDLIERAPLAEMADGILLGALAILREAAVLRPGLATAIAVSEVHRLSYAGSALWISAKTAGTRTKVPQRSLMSKVTRVHPKALTDLELELITVLNWNVTPILRRYGVLD